MRRDGIVHADLAAALTGLRHTDLFAVSDSGLPVPPQVDVIDLGVLYGVPDLLTVVRAVVDEVEVEAAWSSLDAATENPAVHDALRSLLPMKLIVHDDFKSRIGRCRFVVRTGEATPYANVLLRAGVPWW